MKYRGNSKIKRQHHLIDELDAFLRQIEVWPEIKAVNPGVITNCRHNDRLKVTIQYADDSGVKCLARAHGAVQEVFLVTSDSRLLIQKLQEKLDDGATGRN